MSLIFDVVVWGMKALSQGKELLEESYGLVEK